jgi:hypothetical protein
MAFLGLLVLVALMIPLVVVLVDSPIGKALARRLEGPDATPQALADLVKKIEILESEVDDLSRQLEALREENQFLQRLIEESPARPHPPPVLPPRSTP